MIFALFHGPVSGWSIGEMAIMAVVIAALVALVCVAFRAFKLAIPPWAIEAFWVVVIALVIIFCIRLVMSM